MAECAGCRSAIPAEARFCPHCGAAVAPTAAPEDAWVGRTVNGKFLVEALVGQGGMGRVYRARHLGLDRPVVLKMLHAAYSRDPQVAQRFQREARAASRLDHPNSIAILDFGAAEDGTLFMAMEHLGGRDLARLLAEDFPLDEPRIVRIGAQILSALAEAHAQGVVHRDLKPENVMVEPRRGEPDFVKVLDFGIAKITAPGSNEPRLTQAGMVFGTPEYMSPEQARGEDLDRRSDLYSTGVLLYQLATGELPFSSDTPVGFLTKHVSEVPVPPRRRRPDLDVGPALDAVIVRALEKDPAARFASADEMRDALLACLPASARAPAPGRTGAARPAPARPSRAAFWAFVAVIVAAAAGGGGIVVATRRAAAARRGSPAAISPAEAEAAAALASRGAPPATADGAAAPARPPPADAAADGAAAPAVASTALRAGPPRAAPPARGDRARARALFRRAEERRAAQDVDGAIALYLQAERADPGLASVQKKLALCYQLKGDSRSAAERYRRYLASNPPDADRVRTILSTLR